MKETVVAPDSHQISDLNTLLDEQYSQAAHCIHHKFNGDIHNIILNRTGRTISQGKSLPKEFQSSSYYDLVQHAKDNNESKLAEYSDMPMSPKELHEWIYCEAADIKSAAGAMAIGAASVQGDRETKVSRRNALKIGAGIALIVGLSPDSLEAKTNHDLIISQKVDLIELNHFYDEKGKLVFDQIIFYNWCESDCRFHVCAWRLLKSQSQIPVKSWTHNDYRAIWHDGDYLRKVRADSFRESWTQYDPELLERDFKAKEKRPGLSQPQLFQKRPDVAPPVLGDDVIEH